MATIEKLVPQKATIHEYGQTSPIKYKLRRRKCLIISFIGLANLTKICTAWLGVVSGFKKLNAGKLSTSERQIRTPEERKFPEIKGIKRTFLLACFLFTMERTLVLFSFSSNGLTFLECEQTTNQQKENCHVVHYERSGIKGKYLQLKSEKAFLNNISIKFQELKKQFLQNLF